MSASFLGWRATMMHRIFDLIEFIEEKVLEYFEKTGERPHCVAIAPAAYRRLIELRAQELAIGNLVIGCKEMKEVETSLGNLCIVIDEVLPETEIALA
jgi:hypothetical protein